MDVDLIIQQIANLHGVSAELVRSEMEQALEAEMESEDPAVQAQWARIPHAGEKCTLEEFLIYVHRSMEL